MNDLDFLKTISQLPINIILVGVVAFLWRKLEGIQGKYENVLIELGKLKGQVDIEARIESKLDQILELKSKKA